MFVFSLLAQAAPFAEVRPGERHDGVHLVLDEGWEHNDAVKPVVRYTGSFSKGASVPFWGTTLPIPVEPPNRIYGSMERLDFEVVLGACRKSDGVCKTFAYRASVPGSVGARADLEKLPKYRSLLKKYARHERTMAKHEAEFQDSLANYPPRYLEAMRAPQRESLDAAAARATQRGVPLLAVIGFIGCDPCLTLAESVLLAPEDPVDVARVELVLLDQFGGLPEIEEWDVIAAPTSVLLNNGAVIDMHEGFAGVETYRRWLDDVMSRADP